MGFAEGKENRGEFAAAPETRVGTPRCGAFHAEHAQKTHRARGERFGFCPASGVFVRGYYFEVVPFAASPFSRSIAFLACSASGPFGRILR
jgi:hypothetical protein